MKAITKAVMSAVLFSAAAVASATPFSVTKAVFTPGVGYGSDWSEVIGADLLDVVFSSGGFSTQNFNLSAVGGSQTFKVGTVNFAEEDTWFFGTYGIGSAETNNLGVSLALTFTNPGSVVNTILANGVATIGPISDSAVDYSLAWTPLTTSFGNGGKYTISLNTLNFTNSGTKDLFATVTLTSADVPEPGSLALIGLGLAGAGFVRRRRAA